MAPKSDFIADIGADHGLVSVELIKREIANKVFAVENKIGPYSRLVSEIKNNLLETQIETSLSFGISYLPSNVSTVIIAGMGGKLIVDILKCHQDKLEHVNYLLVDAHSDLEYLRREVVSLGYKIENETIILEDKVYYEIILFKKGNAEYSVDEYRFGPILIKEKEETFILKWSMQINKYRTLLEDENINKNRKKELKNEIERISKQLWIQEVYC